jgi:signal transduction histidine kinase
MKLRGKLLALSLLTLLLPWSAWKLLQELESFLRESQEDALQAAARTMAGVLPLGFQTRLLFLPADYLLLRDLPPGAQLDGYDYDWPDAGRARTWASERGDLEVDVLAGERDGRLHLLFEVRGAAREAGAAPRGRLVLEARDPRGLYRFSLEPEAPGPLQQSSERGGAGQLEGFWLERDGGYRVELRLPVAAADTDLRFEVQERGAVITRVAGPAAGSAGNGWIGLVGPWDGMSRWMAASGMNAARSWLVGPQGWVLADSRAVEAGQPADAPPAAGQRTNWVQRNLYRLASGSHTRVIDDPGPEFPVRLDEPAVRRALAGAPAADWTRERETAVVRNTVAVPVELEGAVRGALVLQSTSDGLLLMTNRAMGRLLFTTLALALALAAALWFFASRLSRRVQRLSGAVSRAMADGADPQPLPLVRDRDELGELARNNEKLLRAVAEYSAYLQTLASKLSHELKTPLAITRSSLDNLAARDLDPETQRFLERAREGVDRQSAIVRAMSEASRLEAAIGAADWAEVDLADLLRGLADGYRAVHPERTVAVETPAGPCPLHCAPDLLAQAVDKLADNALSLSGPGDTVTLLLETAPDGYQLAVRNTGSRLPDALRERLFDSLVSMRDKRGGTPHLGLGLYIVRLVAAAHGGTVTARNLPDGAGVEFRLDLPASRPRL